MDSLKLILVDPNAAVCSAWRRHFDDLPNVEVVNDRFEALPEFDCVVSAANSFGIMDGGVDLAIIQFFGIELMDRVQDRIIIKYRGEQPVGTSFIIETGHLKHPFLALRQRCVSLCPLPAPTTSTKRCGPCYSPCTGITGVINDPLR